MIESDLIRKAMAASPFLKSCHLEELSLKASSCRAGQIVNDCPGGVASVGLVILGQVDVYSIAPDGKDVQLSSLVCGDCFGICNLLEATDLGTVLRCRVDSSVLYIPKEYLLRILKQDPSAALCYAKLCNAKLQFLLRRIEFLTMQSCRGKIIAFLLSHRNADKKIRLRSSREVLASHLGISRAALFRELAVLQTKGLLQIEKDTLTILNQEELENMLYYSESK